MLTLPLPVTDELKLADWLELHALMSADENSSYIDLERALRRESVFDLDNNSDEDVECQIQDVSLELERRELAADRAYPFEVDDRGIHLRDSRSRFAPYIFCLCLSVFGSDQELNKKPYPRRMFEYLCCEAAKNFVRGDVVRFGSPRQEPEMSTRFDRAVGELCMRIGEGNGFRAQRTALRKDDGLDLVAWRDFPDRTEGKLLLVGNCASGKDWENKLDELQPHIFCEQWMSEVPVSIHVGIRAFFVPRRLNSSDWKRVSKRAGMIFDRCRIAYWVSETEDFTNEQQYLNWTQGVLVRAAR